MESTSDPGYDTLHRRQDEYIAQCCLRCKNSQFCFTQCPLCVAIQRASILLWRLCLEPVTSSHWPPTGSFLHSHTTASSLQGAVTFQLSPELPSTMDTDTLCSIPSSTSGGGKEKTMLLLLCYVSRKLFTKQIYLDLRLTQVNSFYLVGF